MNAVNGIESWTETYWEVVAHISGIVSGLSGTVPKIIADVQNKEGRTGLYNLAVDWTDKFEALYEGEEWPEGVGLEWWEVLDNWLLAMTNREDGYSVTDPDSLQRYQYKGKRQFEFIENRIINPETREVEEYRMTLSLDDYNDVYCIEACSAFGYDREMILNAYNFPSFDDIVLILECIFELSHE